jgi:cysteine desulfuration protein SufE
MSLPAAARLALEAFAHAGGWEARARLLMQWGERLAPLSEAERSDANRVHGCESQVWLVRDGAEPLHFRAASDARLLRGLLALLLVRVNGLAVAELASLDLADWFAALGLQRQLNPSRSNGLNAVLRRMREMAEIRG